VIDETLDIKKKRNERRMTSKY